MFDEYLGQVGQAVPKIGGRVIVIGHPLVGDMTQLQTDVVQHRHQQMLTILEMPVEGGPGDLGRGGDVVERDFSPGLVLQQAMGGVE